MFRRSARPSRKPSSSSTTRMRRRGALVLGPADFTLMFTPGVSYTGADTCRQVPGIALTCQVASSTSAPRSGVRRSGGIGRHARFRVWWGQPRGGSSPLFGTTPQRLIIPRDPGPETGSLFCCRPALRNSRSEPEVRQAGVVVRTTAGWPEVLAVGLGDGQVVDDRVAAPHEPAGVELPVLVAVRTEPVAAVVVPLVREPNGDAISGHRPELLDETVVQLPIPLARQELHDGLAAGDELGAI